MTYVDRTVLYIYLKQALLFESLVDYLYSKMATSFINEATSPDVGE